MTRLPTVHETSLDLSLIESISQFAAPYRVTSQWTVRLDTHYLGGDRHFGEWEVADIGFIVVWRDRGKVRTTPPRPSPRQRVVVLGTSSKAGGRNVYKGHDQDPRREQLCACELFRVADPSPVQIATPEKLSS